jgi:hypothetical protein
VVEKIYDKWISQSSVLFANVNQVMINIRFYGIYIFRNARVNAQNRRKAMRGKASRRSMRFVDDFAALACDEGLEIGRVSVGGRFMIASSTTR